ncbi:hypothetical protein O181_083194 [Austropuccinia psidii MF-1]|uniref:Reverse transcriptase domain-containing protein n=1 Tax=Austropuccinia psidii MF-1 TaxID=1389203 RepID=A0A9Q3FQQ1_9BASI|nr:hypothetical protein [Austropuccinia psidii MF-1]
MEELWDEEEEPEEIETMMKAFPSVYHQYLDVFSKVKGEKLPPHRACDHQIELEASLPPEALSQFYQLKEAFTTAPIVSHSFLLTAPVIIILSWSGLYLQESRERLQPDKLLFNRSTCPLCQKKDGGLRLCVHYSKLNAVTRKNKYPVPPMNQLLNVFNGSLIFSKIDLRGAYNLLKIKEGDERLTCFRTKYGSFEYLVMPFGLNNAPASFQNLVNDIFHHLLDVDVVVYLDDIMVFSKSEKEHITHLFTVLSRLRANNRFSQASKCLFHVSSVEYLAYVVSFEGLKMDQEKVQQILNWPPPRNLKALQLFLGFANFYRCFIKNYSKKISSLTRFLKKDSCFPLNEEALRQFHQLKEAFNIAAILSHFDLSLPTIVQTDASDYALSAVLSQISDSAKHPIAFSSCKLLPAELNYEIHDK